MTDPNRMTSLRPAGELFLIGRVLSNGVTLESNSSPITVASEGGVTSGSDEAWKCHRDDENYRDAQNKT